ncbi:MAG: hypothetical protein GXO80_01465 [Chlorobi bacterium]|nr:hypothetical protein [Chlorobiota bacterium]
MKNKSSKQFLTELYNQDIELKTETGEKFEVPVSGSLGLLALGYKGLIAWRKVKRSIEKKK